MRSEHAWRVLALLLVLLQAGCYDGDPGDFREAVVVGREQVTGLSLTTPATVLETGTRLQLTATATTATGPRNLSDRVTWRSSNPAVLFVDGGGEVTALADGSATLSAELGVYRDQVVLTASSAQLVGIAVAGAGLVDECDVAAYTATGTYEDSTTRDITSLVSWSTSDTAVARMSTRAEDANLLLSRQAGTVGVRAGRGGLVSPDLVVTVADTLTALAVTPDPSSVLDTGATRQFTATATWGLRSADVSRAAGWTVTNDDPTMDAVATVLQGDTTPGLLTARSGGNAVLAASCGGLEDTVAISVVTLDSLAITNRRPIELAPDATVLLALEGTYSNGSTRPLNEDATWSVSTVSGTGVTVSNTAGSRGRVTAGSAEGVSTVSARVGGREVSVSITVTR